MWLLQQAVPTVAGWVGPTMAVSLVIIALSFLAGAMGILLVVRGLGEVMQRMAHSLELLHAELVPTLNAMKEMADDGRALVASVRTEVTAITGASQKLREGLESGAGQVQERLEYLESLYDVIEEELTETALDVTAALHTVRRGVGLAGRIGTLLGMARRRRRRR
ncbi:MAG: DUF948 domain-containing protein [Gemmatimonadales bacterium]